MNAVPSPKPNRRKRPYGRPLLGRFALRFAALVVAMSALGAAYWFTRPPELVWWTGPEMGKSGKHVRLRVPRGWEWDQPLDFGGKSKYGWVASRTVRLVDRRPKFIRWLSRQGLEAGYVSISMGCWYADIVRPSDPKVTNSEPTGFGFGSGRFVLLHDKKTWANVDYERSNGPTFNRTYRQICNSVRIE
jgi:hypothetical protein